MRCPVPAPLDFALELKRHILLCDANVIFLHALGDQKLKQWIADRVLSWTVIWKILYWCVLTFIYILVTWTWVCEWFGLDCIICISGVVESELMIQISLLYTAQMSRMIYLMHPVYQAVKQITCQVCALLVFTWCCNFYNYSSPITGCAVAPASVLTATGQVNWRWHILTPHRIETHEPTATKFCTVDYVRERTP